MVRSLDLLGQRHLAADASDRLSAGKSVSFLEARDLCFAVGGDHDDFVDAFVNAGFEQQRHIVNHHGFGIFSGCLSRQSGLFACDARVNDSFELAQFGFATEDDGAQRMTIERAIRVEGGFAERVHDLSPCRLAWLDDVTRKFIGINDDGTAMLEHLGDGALTGGDAACEAEQNHGCGAYQRLLKKSSSAVEGQG